MKILKTFASDNYASVHPEILDVLARANQGHAPAYGGDLWTKQLEQTAQKIFGQESRSFLVWNGTGANITGMAAVLKPFQAVIAVGTAHIHVDECGAPERFLGSKLIEVPETNGKLSPQSLKRFVSYTGVEHNVQPHLVSISQSTELGTVYSADEIRSLAAFVHAQGWLLHMDGARISNACVTLGLGLREGTFDLGVDILSLGGTKNGLMAGEMVVFKNESLAADFKFVRKQGMQLASKMRYLSAAFDHYLVSELWKRNAQKSNAAAKYLRAGMESFAKTVQFTQETQSNAVFCILPPEKIELLQQLSPFYVWNPLTFEVRLMTSWDTELSDIEEWLIQARKAGL